MTMITTLCSTIYKQTSWYHFSHAVNQPGARKSDTIRSRLSFGARIVSEHSQGGFWTTTIKDSLGDSDLHAVFTGTSILLRRGRGIPQAKQRLNSPSRDGQ